MKPGFAEDAWEPSGDEGRGKLRKAGGSRNMAMIPGFPNRVTGMPRGMRPGGEHIAFREEYAGE